MKSQQGFSLLEVLVATLIMGIAVTGLIVGLSNAVRNASRLADYDRAAMQARTKMNDLLLDVNLPLDGEVDGQVDGEAWRAVLKPFDVPPNAGPGTVILQQIDLEISWKATSGNTSKPRTLEIQAYRQTRIPNPQTP
jgi:general secretion pathway protein I